MVATEGWLNVSQMPAIELARQYTGAHRQNADVQLAAVIYTNIANDGMMQGVDDQTIEDMVTLAELGLPVIASGGVTTLEDVRKLTQTSREHPNLIGAIIGRALYEGTIPLDEAIKIAAAGES
jgi:phosphoribosylformimino-5-aminoimidazole carboxamide ribotide isomerase